jgi:hypothetical protein
MLDHTINPSFGCIWSLVSIGVIKHFACIYPLGVHPNLGQPGIAVILDLGAGHCVDPIFGAFGHRSDPRFGEPGIAVILCFGDPSITVILDIRKSVF